MEMPVPKNFTCPICQANNTPNLFRYLPGVDGKECRLVQCDNCGMIVVWPYPSAEFLNKFYKFFYKGIGKQGIIEYGDPLQGNRCVIEDCYTKLNYVSKYTGPSQKGTLLDIGCGHGFFVYAAEIRGYASMGADIDKEAINFGRSNLGVNIMECNNDSLADKLPLGNFDVITAWTLLEHLRMPTSCCETVYKLLKPGGIFVGAVPNIEGIGFRIWKTKWHLMIPEHLNYFSDRTLKRFLTKSGFLPLFVGTIPLYASPYFSFGIRKALMEFSEKTPIKVAKILSKKAHRALGLIKRHLIYRLLNMLIMRFNLGGDNILFVARKESDKYSGK